MCSICVQIRLNPLLAEFSDSPYSVDLSLTEGNQKDASSRFVILCAIEIYP